MALRPGLGDEHYAQGVFLQVPLCCVVINFPLGGVSKRERRNRDIRGWKLAPYYQRRCGAHLLTTLQGLNSDQGTGQLTNIVVWATLLFKWCLHTEEN